MREPDELDRARALLASPRFAPPTRPPPDHGHVLAELPRDDGSTLLVAVQRATSTGPPYLHLGVWRGGWPEKGRSVALRPAGRRAPSGAASRSRPAHRRPVAPSHNPGDSPLPRVARLP